MSDTPMPGADAPANEPVVAPEVAPTRATFVVVEPLVTPDKTIGSGNLVSLTPAEAETHKAVIRVAEDIDRSRFGRVPFQL